MENQGTVKQMAERIADLEAQVIELSARPSRTVHRIRFRPESGSGPERSCQTSRSAGRYLKV